jgi:spoIIIJ-associated protein
MPYQNQINKGVKEMRAVEREGKTAEEAIESALNHLKVSRERVRVEILDEGKRGLFGRHFKPAKVRVVIEEEEGDIAQEICKELLKLMKVSAEVNLKEMEDKILLEIRGEDVGILIGKRGRTLNALQYIIRLLAERRGEIKKKILLDSGGYRARRERNLIRLANRIAREVAQTKKEKKLPPMNPHERHIIHASLQDNTSVVTRSIGEGLSRRVIIAPRGAQNDLSK